jgi:hypothetical protein
MDDILDDSKLAVKSRIRERNIIEVVSVWCTTPWRPPAYPNKGYILVRTNLPLKRALCSISLRTDEPKFSTMYDPGRGQFAPVWTKDRSVMRTNCSWP